MLFEDNGTGNPIIYYYGIDGVIGFRYKGTDYYYRKNIQGDVIEIYTASGTLAASYVYDAFGNILRISDHNNYTVANINPFRFKSYYYDTETGLYYLNSRYYDPETGRFISPDSLDYLDPETLGGINLYSYCNNNPVMYADPSGNFAISALIIGAIIGATIGFGVAGYIDYQDDGEIFNGSVKWYDYLGATVLGGAIGAALGAFAGMSFSATLPTGFALAQTSTGTMVLVATGSMTLTVTGAQILGAAGILGATYMFAKGGLPSNKHQNQQWAEAMRQLGIENRDLWQRLHNEIQKHPYNTHDNLRKLIKLLEEILKKWGKL